MTSTLQSNASRSSIPLNNNGGITQSHSTLKLPAPTPPPAGPPSLPLKSSERLYSHSSVTPSSNGRTSSYSSVGNGGMPTLGVGSSSQMMVGLMIVEHWQQLPQLCSLLMKMWF